MTERSRGLSERLPAANSIALAAMIVALVALILSMGGWAHGQARPNPVLDELKLITTATGSTTFPAGGGAPLPLDGAEFTQEAGVTVLLVSHLTMQVEPGEGFDACLAQVFFEAQSATEGEKSVAADLKVGGGGIPVGSFEVLGLAPPGTNLAYEIVSSGGAGGDCDFEEGFVGDPPDITVELEVAVLALR